MPPLLILFYGVFLHQKVNLYDSEWGIQLIATLVMLLSAPKTKDCIKCIR